MTTKAQYIVTSKPGMTPYATVSTKAEAKRESQKAKRIGLDGEIIKIK
jgi:hypothetical protein